MYACKYCGSHEFGIDIINLNTMKGLEVYCKNCDQPVEARFINQPENDEDSPLAA